LLNHEIVLLTFPGKTMFEVQNVDENEEVLTKFLTVECIIRLHVTKMVAKQ
jgi:hypothetical protein